MQLNGPAAVATFPAAFFCPTNVGSVVEVSVLCTLMRALPRAS
jgi:hypothetical protein